MGQLAEAALVAKDGRPAAGERVSFWQPTAAPSSSAAINRRLRCMSILLPLRVTPGASVRPTVRHTQAAGDCVTRTLSRAVASPRQTRPRSAFGGSTLYGRNSD